MCLPYKHVRVCVCVLLWYHVALQKKASHTHVTSSLMGDSVTQEWQALIGSHPTKTAEAFNAAIAFAWTAVQVPEAPEPRVRRGIRSGRPASQSSGKRLRSGLRNAARAIAIAQNRHTEKKQRLRMSKLPSDAGGAIAFQEFNSWFPFRPGVCAVQALVEGFCKYLCASQVTMARHGLRSPSSFASVQRARLQRRRPLLQCPLGESAGP